MTSQAGSNDFKDFAQQILDHLQVDSNGRQKFETLVSKVEGAKARRLEGLRRSMEDGSMEQMMKKMMRPKVQEYEGGPWRPMTDEELAEEGYGGLGL